MHGMRHYFHTCLDHRVQTLPQDLEDVPEKASSSGLTLPSSIQDFGEKLMQHQTELNLVTLQKLIKNNATANVECD